jgi:hypothetical protein
VLVVLPALSPWHATAKKQSHSKTKKLMPFI